jgi:hypothetical protein
MKKLSQSAVAKIKQLRGEGYSYKEISKITCLSVGTVFNYAHTVPISHAGLKRLQNLQIVTRNKFIEKFGQCKPVTVKHKNITIEKARIVGHCLFDGFVSGYVVSYTSASKDLATQFVKDIAKEYSFSPSLKTYEGKFFPYYEIFACSKIMCDDIRKFVLNADTRSSQMLIKEIESENEDIVAEIARAFWEDEGSISVEGNLIGEIKNKSLRDQLIKLHDKLGIQVTPYHDHTYDCYGIYVKRERINLTRFCQKIGFRYGVVTAGKRAGHRKSDVLLECYEGVGGPAGI